MMRGTTIQVAQGAGASISINLGLDQGQVQMISYDDIPPSGAIFRLWDWIEGMTREEADHSLLLDIVDCCDWPPTISNVWQLGGRFERHVEFDVPKPNSRRPGESGTSSSIQIDPEGLGVLMVLALAGGQIRKDSRGDGKYHYLVVAFPERTFPVHRLIVDAPEDQDAELPDHHDYRRRSLGSLLTTDRQRVRHGVDRVRLASRGTRLSCAEMAVRYLHQSTISRFISEEEYLATLALAYLYLDDLPLGKPY